MEQATVQDIDVALEHLKAALVILDRAGADVAAANLDHIIETLQVSDQARR